MKLEQILHRLSFAVLFCMVATAEDDLADFDFTELKEIEWNYDIERLKEHSNAPTEREPLVAFDEFEEDNQVRPFDWREKVLRGALSKALTNTALRQKFVEVMPILRVLSPQQRLALSALISSQINAKTDQGLNLEQVRMMFGDDKKLLLPIVYDIANLVRNSARKYLYHGFSASLTAKDQHKPKSVIDRRLDILTSSELAEEDNVKNMSNISITTGQGSNDLSLEDFFSETGEDILDPQSINEELQKGVGKSKEDSTISKTLTLTGAQSEPSFTKRNKRSVTEPEFVHKLIRSVPLSKNPDDIDNNETRNMVKLNTSGFLSSKDLIIDSITKDVNTAVKRLSTNGSTLSNNDQIKSPQSYQEVEDAAFASFNETGADLQEPTESLINVNTSGEPLPTPEELNAGPRYRKIHSSRPNPLSTKRKRIQVSRIRTKMSTKGIGGGGSNGVAPSKKCERFTSSMCIRTDDYPLDQIMGSIRRHKNAMVALWADYHDKSFHLDIPEDFDEYPIRRREDDATGGGMCQSIVRYARPQKARSASGEWKYIVNTGKHTQTLRLEKCTTPQESCSYLAQSYRSHCAQIYNYHRLLSWDKTRGLHVDIFKVPTCCSCQVDGFRQQFPPLTKDFTPAHGSDVYSTINEELDYNDELDEDDLNYQLHSGFKGKHKKHDTGYNNNELLLGSQSVQTKLHAPNPTLGSYLKPPGGEQEYEDFNYKVQQQQYIGKSSVSPGKIAIDSSRRRPYKSLDSTNIYNEARVDLDFSPSELHQEKEVNFSGGSLANPNNRVQQKRQRIHSVPHTANISTSSSIPEREGPNVSSVSNNFYMATGFETPATMVETYEVSGNLGDVTTNAHQASAPSSINHSTLHKQANFSNNINGIYKNRPFVSRTGKKPKPRFRSAAAATTMAAFVTATVTRATPSQTESTNQWSIFQSQQPASAQPKHITSFHMNSVYSPGYNQSTDNVGNNIHTIVNDSEGSVRTASDSVPKRINYSYHPIIDFFETHKYLTSETTTASSSTQTNDIKNENPFPHRITKYQPSTQPKGYGRPQTHERRIGFSIKSSVNSANNFHSDDNAWHPVIVDKK